MLRKVELPLGEIITRKNLMGLAGGRSFSRGEEYFKRGLVGVISEKNGVISANIHGTRIYDTRLKCVPEAQVKVRLDYSCSCPVGRDGDFCKHCVALGLAWMEKSVAAKKEDSDAKASATRQATPRKEVSQRDIRKWLEAQDQKLILDMMMEQIKADGRLREDLILRIAKENAGGIDLSAYRRAISAAFHTYGFISYHDMYEYAEGVSEVIDSIERLCKEGFANEAILLAEYAFEQAALAVGNADDSDGHFGDFCERLSRVHWSACKAAKPDPVDLAKRLFAFEMMDSNLDIFYGAAELYKAILGKQGLAEYRRLAEKEWATVQEKGSGSRDTGYSGRRFRITSVMESLAKADGDIDALIAVKKRDLSKPYSFLEIAEICKKTGRSGEALEWAEKGITSFPENQDNRLRDFIAEEYHRRKRYDDAYRLYRIQFTEHPELEQYKKLMGYAKKINRADVVREDALSYLREMIEKEKSNPKMSYWHFKPDSSRLVEIFLWEKDVEAAWSEAKTGGCRDRLWLDLAKLRETGHPADAIEVYKRLIETIIEQKNNQAYDDALRMAKKIRDLMGRLDKTEEFTRYLTSLRLRHKPKRNLMKLLDKLQ